MSPLGLVAARTCSRYVNTRRLRETSALFSCEWNLYAPLAFEDLNLQEGLKRVVNHHIMLKGYVDCLDRGGGLCLPFLVPLQYGVAHML